MPPPRPLSSTVVLCERASRSLFQWVRTSYPTALVGLQTQSIRGFRSTTAVAADDGGLAAAHTEPFYKNPDPVLVTSPRLEKKLMKQGIAPVGSRRRRAALQGSPNIPFEQLPYQCFQEARKILQADREKKLQEIQSTREKIARCAAAPAEDVSAQLVKKSRLRALELHLERLMVLADINDPMVKRKFEDGLADMNKPVYRFLADRKWREYRRKILVQRITQMKVVPDVLPHCDPVVDAKLYFGRRVVQPGAFVNSRVSMDAPKLDVQLFERGEKLVTIAVVDSDVPNVETDSFDYKMHYLAVNVPLSISNTKVDLATLSTESQIVLPWLPPVAQKGSPYHRLSIFIMEQANDRPLDFSAVKARETDRDNLLLRTLQSRYKLKAIGVHLFRTEWDLSTLDVMREIGFPDADVELRRKRVEPLPYKRRNPASFR